MAIFTFLAGPRSAKYKDGMKKLIETANAGLVVTATTINATRTIRNSYECNELDPYPSNRTQIFADTHRVPSG